MNLPSGDEAPPTAPGLYLVYIDPDVDVPFAERKLLMWTTERRWGYLGSDQYFRGHVYGWIGPIPAMKLVDLSPPRPLIVQHQRSAIDEDSDARDSMVGWEHNDHT